MHLIQNMKSKCSTLFLLVAVFLFACNEGNVDLDNAGNDTRLVQIDGVLFELEAKESKLIKLDRGLHSILIQDADGKTLQESNFQVDHGGLINLSESEYLIWTDLYGNKELRKTKLKEDWVEIGGQEFYGDFFRLPKDQIYVEKRWDYGLTEEFPEDLLGWQPTREKYIIKSKLFRKEGLIEVYRSMVQK